MRILFLVFVFLGSSLHAQDYLNQKYDRQLIVSTRGGFACKNFDPSDSIYRRGTVMDFNHDTLTMWAVDTFYPDNPNVPPKVYSLGHTAQIADTAGRFLAQFNGVYLISRNYETHLMNMFEHKDFPNVYYTDASIGSGVMLPFPGRQGYYITIATNDYHDYPEYQLNLAEQLSAFVFKDNADGSVTVTEKYPTLHKSLYHKRGAVTACRHANGRDWWLLCPKYKSSTMHYFLVDPTGIHYSHDQDVGVEIFDKCYFGTFSPDGHVYVRTQDNRIAPGYYDSRVQIFTFDRCAGLLTEFSTFKMPTSFLSNLGQVVFDRTNRYFYAIYGTTIYQGDITADDVEASLIFLGKWDSTLIDNGRPLAMGFGFLAPDDKIYIFDGADHTRTTVIHHPSERGEACGFVYAGLTKPSCASMFENRPDFNLGPLDGSPCDTLGLDAPLSSAHIEKVPDRYQVAPNPTSGSLKVFSPDDFRGRLLVYNQLGQRITAQDCSQDTEIDLSAQPTGIYFVIWQDRWGRTCHVGKVMVVR